MIIYSTYGDTFETSKLYLTQYNFMVISGGITRRVNRSELKKAFELKQGKVILGKYSTWKKSQKLWYTQLIRENRKPIKAKIGCMGFTGENLVKLLKWARG